MGDGERRVLAHLASSGGVIRRDEAIALGMSPATITRRVRDGHLVGVAKGLYVQPAVLRTERAILRAAATALGATASHESAARLHGLEGLDPARVAVTVPIRRSNRFEGVIVHQLTDLTADHTTQRDGIPVTTATRTVIDLAAVLPSGLLTRVLDQTVRRRLCTYESVAWLLEDLARSGKPGVTTLRSVLKPRLGGSFSSESVLETRLFDLIAASGLPMPQTQFRPPWLKHMHGRVDLAYPEETLIVEADSQQWHGSPEAFQADRRRDNLAQLAGWMILRFTWEDVTKRSSYVADSIRRALSRSVDDHN